MNIAKLSTRTLLVFGTLTFIIMIVVNGLAGSTELINGLNTGEVSDSQPNLFAPIGWTFAIWGVIYTLLAVFLVQAWRLGNTDETKQVTLKSILGLFVATNILNTAWLFSWQYGVFWLSVCLMLALLVSLLALQKKLSAYAQTTEEKLTIKLPFSVYLGWISVATIANITTWLVSIGWNGFGLTETFWTIVILIIGVDIALLNAHKYKDIALLAVFVWAYSGIYAKHISPEYFNSQYSGIITTLMVLLAVLVLATIFLAYTKLQPRKDLTA